MLSQDTVKAPSLEPEFLFVVLAFLPLIELLFIKGDDETLSI